MSWERFKRLAHRHVPYCRKLHHRHEFSMSENARWRIAMWSYTATGGRYMPAAKKSTSRRSTSKTSSSAKGMGRVGKVMHEYKLGTLKSGKGGIGGKVKSRKQAVAIGLSEARKAGAKIPRKGKKSP